MEGNLGGRISADEKEVAEAPRLNRRKLAFQRHSRDQAHSAIEGTGAGTRDDPWRFSESSGSAGSIAFRDTSTNPPAVVVQVGSAEYRYHLGWLEDSGLPLAGDGPAGRKQGLRGQLNVYARSLLATLGLGVPGNPHGEG